jgi:hypothetical protein
MALPRRIPKERKRSDRWRSPAHCTWIRGFACCNCGSTTNVIVAHVRIGSHTALGAKPDDWRTVPLCDGPWSGIDGQPGCHNRQHDIGERTFWNDYAGAKGQTIDQLLDELAKASPRAAEIRNIQRERGDARS